MVSLETSIPHTDHDLDNIDHIDHIEILQYSLDLISAVMRCAGSEYRGCLQIPLCKQNVCQIM